ncbi:unnamed protein product [Caenorhabditis sp. 36 PRJEB53466]|nr:unnamed protein product [Caenorhabditis sp. 36 PRJEB53466]
METAKKSAPVDIAKEKEQAAGHPDGKTPENRPKYVHILQQEKSSQRPSSTRNKSPAALGASPSSNDSPLSDAKSTPQMPNRSNDNMKNVAPNGKRPFKVYLRKQDVVALPAEMEIRELTISQENVLFFSGPAHYLSALYPVKVNVDGNEYNSVEHYYQACKLYTLVGKESAAQLKSAVTPLEVKKATKDILKGKVPSKAVAEWKVKDSIAVLKHAITQKFKQNEDLKQKLLETGDKILIQTYIGDNFFAAGANPKYTTNWIARHVNQSLKIPAKVSSENVQYLPLVANGKNALGWILMHVRHELQAESA